MKSLLKNPISFIGIAIAVASTAVGIPLMFYDIFASQTNPYTGIMVYMVLPGVAAFGVAVILLGMLITDWRRRRGTGKPWQFPHIDLNQAPARRTVLVWLSVMMVTLVLLSITGYRGYHFTESVHFCGMTCHGVMKPEHTAYLNSPHARVACVACHVGPGAGWYVKSKLSGAYQVYSVAFNKYSRPIQTPVHNLRPAQETCEQCHWPAKFFGAQQKTFTHYLADEKNSPWEIQTLIRIGGGERRSGSIDGIHKHMNIANEIHYVATDEKRETIPWVKAMSKDGKTSVEYMSVENPLTPAQLAEAKHHRMDCVDCHNRPSHIFQPPDRSLDFAFETGRLDTALPFVKREGMRLIATEYQTEAEGRKAIREGIAAFYSQNYAALARKNPALVQQAAETLEDIFATTVFPEMKTDWRVHPNHIGHLNSDGCFRCHDGQHQSADGGVITNDCNACHTFLAQGSPKEVAKARLQAQPFRHPVDIGGADLNGTKCSACHNGTIGL